MRSRLGQMVTDARQANGWSAQALARRLGYSPRRCNKGARRIAVLEEHGLEEAAFVRQVAQALGLQVDQVVAAAEADEAARREGWERWADEQIEPFLIVRYATCAWGRVYRRIPPDHHEPQAAEQFASALARQLEKAVQLVLSRRVTVWYDEYGRETSRAATRYNQPM
jgi:transcriptional regulator with XRE-family HTH domain